MAIYSLPRSEWCTSIILCFCEGGYSFGFLVTSIASMPGTGSRSIYAIEKVGGQAAEGLAADFTCFTLRLRSERKRRKLIGCVLMWGQSAGVAHFGGGCGIPWVYLWGRFLGRLGREFEQTVWYDWEHDSIGPGPKRTETGRGQCLCLPPALGHCPFLVLLY